jgi:ribulose-phosphate 3-epimerase
MADIIPTVVPKSLDDIARARKRYPFAASLHVDVADGVFAPNTTWSISPSEKLPDAAAANYEVHLMVQNPLQAGLSFARAGAMRIIGHVEAFDHAERAQEAFDMWQKAGAKEVGIAVLMETSLEELTMYVGLCDFVHMMTIATIGKQGIPFDPRSLERVATFHKRYPRVTISVDGGGSKDTIEGLLHAGATRFCVGSALTKAKDPEKEFARLQKIAA